MPTLNKMRALLLSPLIFGYIFLHPEALEDFAKALDLIPPSQETKKEEEKKKKKLEELKKNSLFLDNLDKCKVIRDMVKPDLKSLQEKNLKSQDFTEEKHKLVAQAFEIIWNQYVESLKENDILPEDSNQLLDALTAIITITSNDPQKTYDAASLEKISNYLATLTFDQLLDLFPFCRFLLLDKPFLEKVEEAFFQKTLDQLINGPVLHEEKLKHVFEFHCIRKKMRLLPEPILLKTLNHKGQVWDVNFSPDGKTVATAAYDKTAKIWDVTTGQCLKTLNHNKKVFEVAFSPDGKTVATSLDDNTAKIWEVKTGECLRTLYHNGKVYHVAFSPDGKKVATSSEDNTAKIWDVTTGEFLLILNHNVQVWYVTFSPDGKKVATSSNDNTAKIWDITTGQCLLTLNHNKEVSHVTFSPNGKTVATASDDNTAKIWDVTNGQCLLTLNHNEGVYHVAFSPDGKKVATSSDDNTAKIWDVTTGQCLKTLNHNKKVFEATFSPDGKTVATTPLDNTAKIWDATNGKCLHTLNHKDWVYRVTFNPDDTTVATASFDNTAKIWYIKEILTLDQYITILLLSKLKEKGALKFSQLNPIIADIVLTLPPSIKQHYLPGA